ncbi:ABC-F family ATP-binding cassette domain-containing protein [Enteractinococcus coprophilus]|uniref:ATPase subunit of ABC transporter with duplicated ATPase domains n=1 Tax=Enteractinococcus coprophilus TaxID=1027633 RepID=A0A543AFC5_9MICC|nr:ABC-F family ATP-binding cassette domain-containing protein [Enteractinococcus coprophilus]TQL71272.1 ATPase subunit of ABC transporter with duplicated ATPase domains [Enteractinococcus coprophilus]
MVHLLGAEALHFEYPTQKVLDAVTLGVSAGDRIGIVGRNGDGKSTLMKLLVGKLEPDAGQVTVRSDTTIGMLDQSDAVDTTLTVGQVIVGDLAEHEWAGDPKIRDIITGLVADLDWTAQVGSLSGGQRRRVALAQLLIGDWDILALDEPTNHLDVEGIAWLADHLNRRWPKNAGGLLVITHDRWFLDEVSTETWEVHDGIVDQFEGGYAAYVLQRVERDRMAATAEAKRQNLLRKELAWLRRGAPARTAKPKFRIDAANQLIEDVPPVRNSIELKRLAVARLGKDVVDIEDASVSFGEREVLRNITWRIAPGERTGILGANGAGKSTLLSLVTGDLEPTGGRVKHGKTVRIGMLDQQFSQLEKIGADRVREVLAQTQASFTIDGKEHTPAQLLERLGFRREHLSARVDDLSGGQKRRLQLLMLLLSEPNVIVLDEPTNDVDSDMLTAMEDLLDSWPGTLIVVSHDRYLLERVTDQQYAILDGTLRHVPGGVDEYLRLRKAQDQQTARNTSVSNAETTKEAGSTSKLTGAERKTAQREVGSIERRLEKLSAVIEGLHQRLVEHDQGDYTGLQRYGEELQEAEDEVTVLEERWLELSEQLD